MWVWFAAGVEQRVRDAERTRHSYSVAGGIGSLLVWSSGLEMERERDTATV